MRPECKRTFKSKGRDGIDAHRRSKHEKVMTYEEFWKACDHNTENSNQTVANARAVPQHNWKPAPAYR